VLTKSADLLREISSNSTLRATATALAPPNMHAAALRTASRVPRVPRAPQLGRALLSTAPPSPGPLAGKLGSTVSVDPVRGQGHTRRFGFRYVAHAHCSEARLLGCARYAHRWRR
jgi:hypothetical protein